jgi:hypothetical protein
VEADDARTPPNERDAHEAKEGDSADPDLPQPEAAEVESARLLANEARDALRAKGVSDTDIDRLAGAFIARGAGTSVEDFVSWAESAAGHV